MGVRVGEYPWQKSVTASDHRIAAPFPPPPPCSASGTRQTSAWTNLGSPSRSRTQTAAPSELTGTMLLMGELAAATLKLADQLLGYEPPQKGEIYLAFIYFTKPLLRDIWRLRFAFP